MISFVETKLFTRLVQEYLSDEEYSKLQQVLLANPESGPVIPGSGASSASCAGPSLGAENAEVSGSSIFYAPGKGRFGC
jgi:hypothetical protein